jgi:hypothetical protein
MLIVETYKNCSSASDNICQTPGPTGPATIGTVPALSLGKRTERILPNRYKT